MLALVEIAGELHLADQPHIPVAGRPDALEISCTINVALLSLGRASLILWRGSLQLLSQHKQDISPLQR